MKISIPLIKQDTTNLFSSNFSFSKDILILEKRQKIRSGKLNVDLECYSESCPLINNVFMYCENSIPNFSLFTNSESVSTEIFSEVFISENLNSFSLSMEYSGLLKDEVFSKFPGVYVTKFIVEFKV